MTETTQTPVAENEAPEVVTDLTKIAGNVGDLPPLPAIAMQILELSRDPDASAKDVQKLISQDQALTTKILKVVNSAMYCLQREVSTVSHAVAILGMETVRSVVLGTSLQHLFNSVRAKDLESKLLGDHSWGAAIAARIVAERVRYPSPEEAFLCGLIHDMGKVVLSKNRSQEYAEIVSTVYAGRGTFVEAELELFGYSHAHVGAVLSAKWNFPQQLAEAILYHHDPLAAPVHTKLAAIVNLGNLIMVKREVGFERDGELELAKQPSAEYLGLDEAAMNGLIEELDPKMVEGLPS